MNNPKEVANLIITAIRNADLNLMTSLFNAINRRKFSPLTEQIRAKLMKLRERELPKISDVKEVEEIREAPSHIAKDAVVAKVSQIGNTVYVIVLTREGDNYYFEDFKSPTIEEYSKLKKLSF